MNLCTRNSVIDVFSALGIGVLTQMCFSYFLVDSAGKVVTNQEGVFRSNCMDCLDRTNVIQSLLARRSLQAQLQVSTTLLEKKKVLKKSKEPFLLKTSNKKYSHCPYSNLTFLFLYLAIIGVKVIYNYHQSTFVVFTAAFSFSIHIIIVLIVYIEL